MYIWKNEYGKMLGGRMPAFFKQLTQEQLAVQLGVTSKSVSKWEAGRGYPSIDSLKQIADYFSVTIDELLSGEKLLSIAEKEKIKQPEQYEAYLGESGKYKENSVGYNDIFPDSLEKVSEVEMFGKRRIKYPFFLTLYFI